MTQYLPKTQMNTNVPDYSDGLWLASHLHPLLFYGVGCGVPLLVG